LQVANIADLTEPKVGSWQINNIDVFQIVKAFVKAHELTNTILQLFYLILIIIKQPPHPLLQQLFIRQLSLVLSYQRR